MGVWWEMISGKSTWAYTNDFPTMHLDLDDQNMVFRAFLCPDATGYKGRI